MSELVRCVYCGEITPGSLYCYVFQRCMSESEANAPRKCYRWRLNTINAITLEDDYKERQKVKPVETIRMEL